LVETDFKYVLYKKLIYVTTLTREETDDEGHNMITLKQTALTLNHTNLRFDIV